MSTRVGCASPVNKLHLNHFNSHRKLIKVWAFSQPSNPPLFPPPPLLFILQPRLPPPTSGHDCLLWNSPFVRGREIPWRRMEIMEIPTALFQRSMVCGTMIVERNRENSSETYLHACMSGWMGWMGHWHAWIVPPPYSHSRLRTCCSQASFHSLIAPVLHGWSHTLSRHSSFWAFRQ